MKSKRELGKLINPVFVCLFEEKKKGEKNMARFKVYNSTYIYIYTIYGDMKYILWDSILDS